MTQQELLQLIEQAAAEGWEELDLRDQQLTELPPEIGKLTKLKVLKLGSKDWWKEDKATKNQLIMLPPELFMLTNLTTLDLSANKLTMLSPEIGRLTNLMTLDISGNQFTLLPDEIFTLTNLIAFDLGYNHLTLLSIEIKKLTKLERLDLTGNQLTVIPSELFTLKKLTKFYLSHNLFQLTELPSKFYTLTDLINFSLSHNQLKSISSNIRHLKKLTKLFLHKNKLTTLPKELFTLTNLTKLWIKDNLLTELPFELCQLTNLEQLYVDGNPLKTPPPEIVELGTQGILAYLREQAQGCQAQWLAKMVLVGEGGVGKTSLLRALEGQPYLDGLDTTRGIAIEPLDLPHPSEAGVTMRLNAWDFGGQEIYHATHQFFLTNRSLFLLIWNARHGYEQGKLYYWLDQIQARAPQSPVLLVATHTDEREAELPLAELQAKYPQIAGNWRVSNKTGDGVAALREAVAAQAATLPLMGEKWPTNWLNAVAELRARPEKHITPAQLFDLMTRQKVSSGGVLARWLHELGDILYFQEDEELNELVVLKPQWVTEYIYKVLDCEDVQCRDGEFTREQKQALWRDLDPEMQEHFLRLMEKFDLSYRTLENREVSLVVERLPLDPPDYKAQWDSLNAQPNCREIAMRFELNTLPSGIPTWFIARAHRFTTHTHWRSGAVFADDDKRHLALVQAFPHHRYLELTARGPHPQNFFTLLKDGIEVTLRRFPGLQIERLMPCPGHDGQPCSHAFDYRHLQTRIERVPPKLEIECPVAMENVSVSELLFGLHVQTQNAVLQRIDALENTMTAQHDEQLRELKELRELTQREFLNAYRREQAQLDARCPNVFVLSNYHECGLKPAILGETLYLKLYCQAPGCWHPTEKGGLYEIAQPAEWLREIAPYARKLVKMLKYVKPLAGQLLAWLPPDFEAAFKDDLKLMETLVDKLPDIDEDRHFALAERVGEHFEERIEGAALRALRKLLDEKDPSQQWGGLKPVLTPEGHYLWLCQAHAAPYLR